MQELKVLIHQSFISMMLNFIASTTSRREVAIIGSILYDSFGDGWNGCMIDVLVDGAVVLDNITLASGYGPADLLLFLQTREQYYNYIHRRVMGL